MEGIQFPFIVLPTPNFIGNDILLLFKLIITRVLRNIKRTMV